MFIVPVEILARIYILEIVSIFANSLNLNGLLEIIVNKMASNH